MKKKTYHFSCKNCSRRGRFTFKGKHYICAGMVKNKRIKGDDYRLCISKYRHRYDFNEVEMLVIVNLLSDLSIFVKFGDGRKK